MEQNATHLPLNKRKEVEPKGQLTTKLMAVVKAHGRIWLHGHQLPVVGEDGPV